MEDPAKPSDTRFLHVLQGADPGAPVQSTGGDAFDGAVFASSSVYFPGGAGPSLR